MWIYRNKLLTEIPDDYIGFVYLIEDLTNEKLCATLILTAFSQRDFIEQARDAGALAYLVKPFQRAELVPAIELAIARFGELKALAEQAATLEEQLESRKIVDRAKGVLMDKHAMSESESFAYIRSTAMSSRSTMKVVAEQVLAGELPKSEGGASS